MKNVVFTCLFCIVSFSAYSQNYFEKKLVVNFDKNIDTLDDVELKNLNEFCTELSSEFILSAKVSGHTDQDGSNAFNMDLSKRRASHITSILLSNNIKTEELEQKNFGERKLLSHDNFEEDKALNRRVEIEVKYLRTNTIDYLMSSINPVENQFFEVPYENIHITGNKGTEIFLDKKNLVFEDGRPVPNNAIVNIELKEINSLGDQLFENIATVSDEGILESGGMFKINVSVEGSPVKLKEGATYDAKIPNKTIQPDMSVYVGNKNEDGSVVWQKKDEKFIQDTLSRAPRPSLCIDEELVSKYSYTPKYDSFYKNFSFEIPKKPIAPHKPFCPREPNLPDINGAKYELSWFRKTFSSQEKVDYLKRLKYDPDYEKYLVKIEKFEDRYERFILRKEEYEKKYKQYCKEQKEYIQALKSCYEKLYYYNLAYAEQLYARTINGRVNSLISRSNEDKLYMSDPVFYLSNINGIVHQAHNNRDIYNMYRELYLSYSEIPDNPNLIPKEYKYFNNGLSMDFNSLIYNQTSELNKKIIEHLKEKSIEYYETRLALGYENKTSSINYYTASLTNFDWINCDRYINTPPEMMVEYNIDSEKDIDVKNKKMYAIVKETNSCIPIYGYSVSLPKDKKAIVVSYYVDDDRMVYYASKELTSSQTRYSLSYEEKTLPELKSILMRL